MSKRTFFCIDAHTCGNPVRVVAGGGPPLHGATMSEKRQHFIRDYDWIRTGLMFEPRGHDVMSGSILYEPHARGCRRRAHLHRDQRLPADVRPRHHRHGHGADRGGAGDAEARGAASAWRCPPASSTPTTSATTTATSSRCASATSPSFLYKTGLDVDVPDFGRVVFDVAYGGNFYAIIEPQEVYRDLDDISAFDIQKLSPVIRKLINEKYTFIHPANPTITGLRHVLWAGKAHNPEAHARNAVFYGEKAIDRSPCGTGTSARMAQKAARGELKVGDDFVHESIIGSLFYGRVEEKARGRRIHGHRAVGRRPGVDHRLQHHLPRRPRSLREGLQRAVGVGSEACIPQLVGRASRASTARTSPDPAAWRARSRRSPRTCASSSPASSSRGARTVVDVPRTMCSASLMFWTKRCDTSRCRSGMNQR